MTAAPDTGNNTVREKEEIDQLTRSFFGVFNNLDGHTPDWDLLRRVCIPEVLIIKKESGGDHVYDLNSFLAPRQKLLSDGTLTHFQEEELASESWITGRLALRMARYRKSGYQEGVYFEAYGHKAFQFMKCGRDWKICSVIWEDDAD